MKRRPWPIVILALLHVIAPIVSTLSAPILANMSVTEYLALVKTRNWAEIFEYYMLFPIAGFALISFRKWSYPVFLTIMSWAFLRHYQNYEAIPQTFTLAMLVGSYALNLGVVTYFFLPSVRAPYYNERLRWWESKPRYRVSFMGSLRKGSQPHAMTVSDISEGGLFIRTPSPFALGDFLKVEFQFLGKSFQFPGHIVHVRNLGKDIGYGVQFAFVSRNEKVELMSIIDCLVTLGYRDCRKDGHWIDDLKTWAKTAVKDGKAWIPSVPQPSAVGAQVVQLKKPAQDSSDKKAA